MAITLNAAPYSDYTLQLGPPWMRNKNGEAYLSALGVVTDGFIEGTIQAVKTRWVGICPPDALQYIGQERGIAQYPGEADESYRARLLSAWNLWTYAGTLQGVRTAIQQLGFSNVDVIENGTWSVPPSPGFSNHDEWWRFWVIIEQPHAFQVQWYWGGGHNYGDGQAWGLNDNARAQAVVAAVRAWRASHSVCVSIIIILSGRLWGYPFWQWGNGTTWGGQAAYLNV